MDKKATFPSRVTKLVWCLRQVSDVCNNWDLSSREVNLTLNKLSCQQQKLKE